MTRWLALISLIAVGVVALPACGNNDDNNSANNPSSNNTPDMSSDTKQDEAADDTQDIGPDEPVYEKGEDVQASGFVVLPPVPTVCDGSAGTYRLPFVIPTFKTRPLVEGDRVGGTTIIPNKSLSVGSIITRRPRIGVVSPKVCTTNADCAGDFVCAPGGDTFATLQCVHQTGLELVSGSVRQDFDNGTGDRKQLVSLLVENSGSLVGYLPQEDGALYKDGVQDRTPILERATDPTRALPKILGESFVVFLASVASGANTKFSARRFGGENPLEVASYDPDAGLEDTFNSDLSKLREIFNMGDPIPNARLGKGNVYQAINVAIDRDFAQDKYKDDEKFMFVFVDGPNELWDKDVTKDVVLNKLKQQNIHLFILHLDAAIDPSLMRDPSAYWGGNSLCRADSSCEKAPTCGSSSDCDTHEECRTVSIYGKTAADATTQTSDKHCIPKYDDTGRIGPIGAYADLACQTGGNYIYAGSIDQLRVPFRTMPSVINGQWSVETTLSFLDTLSDGFYRLSGTFLGAFGNQSIGNTLSAPIPSPLPNNPDSVDNRVIVRVGTPKGK